MMKLYGLVQCLPAQRQFCKQDTWRTTESVLVSRGPLYVDPVALHRDVSTGTALLCAM